MQPVLKTLTGNQTRVDRAFAYPIFKFGSKIRLASIPDPAFKVGIQKDRLRTYNPPVYAVYYGSAFWGGGIPNSRIAIAIATPGANSCSMIFL